jgi:putrescine aminotransferase
MLHSSTFSSFPLGAAAAQATIEVTREEDVPRRAKELGELILDLRYVPGQAVGIADRNAKGYRLALAFSFGLGGHNSAVGFATS